MCNTKKTLVLVSTSLALGAIFGALYAPAEGSETRRKLSRLKRKLGCSKSSDMDEDRENLEDLSAILQKELRRVNDRIEKLGK